MEEEIIEDVEEIDTLIAELEISKGKGNLILCVVNSPLYRDRIVQTLKGRFSSNVIVAENGEEIISVLKRKSFDSADVLVWVMPEEPTENLLNTLNNFRELFYESNIPNLMFYNQAFSESVIKKAPDFWRYRGNYYEFKDEEGGLTFEALEALTTPLNFKDKEDLLRRKGINEYLLEKVKDKEEKSEILNEVGIIFSYLGEFNKALEYYKKAMKLYEELGKNEGIAAQLGNIGIVFDIKGEHEKALEYFEKALKLYEELGRTDGIAAQLENVGIVCKNKGEFDKALGYLKKALKLNEELGEKEGIAISLGNIGLVYKNKGEFDKALEYFKKALKLNEELERKEGIANQFGNLGALYSIQGEFDKAMEYLEKALKLNEELGGKEGMAVQFGNLGFVYREKGELNKALEYNEKALEIFKDMGSKIETARSLMNIGEIFVLKGDKKNALNYYLEAQDLAKGSHIFEHINKELQRLKKKVIAKDIQKNTKVKALS